MDFVGKKMKENENIKVQRNKLLSLSEDSKFIFQTFITTLCPIDKFLNFYIGI